MTDGFAEKIAWKRSRRLLRCGQFANRPNLLRSKRCDGGGQDIAVRDVVGQASEIAWSSFYYMEIVAKEISVNAE